MWSLFYENKTCAICDVIEVGDANPNLREIYNVLNDSFQEVDARFALGSKNQKMFQLISDLRDAADGRKNIKPL